MTQVAPKTNKRAVAFSRWLGSQIAAKQISQRTLGRLIDKELPERGRRQVVRHLSGRHYPSPSMRARYADVFGEEYVEDDDDEEDDLVLRLHRIARDARDLARRLENDRGDVAEGVLA